MTPMAHLPRRFRLVRKEDESGISGTGLIADGVQFEDGSCVLRWRTEHKSTALYDSHTTLMAVHGHNGKTFCEWVDTEEPLEDAIDALKRVIAERDELKCSLTQLKQASQSTQVRGEESSLEHLCVHDEVEDPRDNSQWVVTAVPDGVTNLDRYRLAGGTTKDGEIHEVTRMELWSCFKRIPRGTASPKKLPMSPQEYINSNRWR